MSRYRNGNRLTVPRTLASRHFLYGAQSQPMNAAARELVVEAVKEQTYLRGLCAFGIEVIVQRQLSAAAAAALEEISAPLTRLACKRAPSAELLVTAQALPHTDPSWEGASFLSVVLHTGPEPYVMQMLHVGRDRSGSQEVMASNRVIRAGDWFVFDPTTPHFVAPMHAHQENLLILMQIELNDRTKEERQAILRELPPWRNDRDTQDFSLF